MKKYVLHPGPIRSKVDGDWHTITARQLAFLYGLRLEDCYVVPHVQYTSIYSISIPPYPGRYEDYIHLFPLFEGNYMPTLVEKERDLITQRQDHSKEARAAAGGKAY